MNIVYGTVTRVDETGYYVTLCNDLEESLQVYDKASNYTPTLYDKVAVLIDKFNYLVICKVD